VALAFLALVAFMFKEAVDHDFATIWAGVGTIVGVTTGAIPSYFFKQQSDKDRQTAQTAQETAQNALLAADPDKLAEVKSRGLIGT
jgi:hypothetical protein